MPNSEQYTVQRDGTQVETNELIERVRRRYAIRGCRFDLATSVDRDGLQVDTSTMWREDYGGGHVYYHHRTFGDRA